MDMMAAATYELAIAIGQMPIVICTRSAEFMRLVENRYGSFVTPDTRNPVFELEIELVDTGYGMREEEGFGFCQFESLLSQVYQRPNLGKAASLSNRRTTLIRMN